MSKFKLNDIYSDNDLTEIKVSDLEYITINNSDFDAVIDLIEKLREKFIILFIGFVLAFILSLILLYSEFKSSNFILTVNIFGGLCISLIFLFWVYYLLKQVLSFRIKSLKKAQYGIVKNKYYFTDTTENGTSIDYRINVKFINNSTYIRSVYCTNEIYDKLSIEDKVLVISFDNKTAYAVICENKQLN